MSCKLNRVTVASIPETSECNLSKKKNSRLLILESNKDVSTAQGLFQGLRNGLISSCEDYNASQMDEKLKELVLSVSPGVDFSLTEAINDEELMDTKTETREDIMQILERSRQLDKENVQIIDGVEVLLSGKGGRPFAKLEENLPKVQETKHFDPELRIKALRELDELLISTLRCTAEVDRLCEINANINIKHCPNSSVRREVDKMRNVITSLYLGSFKEAHGKQFASP
ncbi:hypothetical protein HWI79_97 [Cryptosporidium felis]|nr:hypothetical protein HWI79_97 [Cryptosporidium felis]